MTDSPNYTTSAKQPALCAATPLETYNSGTTENPICRVWDREPKDLKGINNSTRDFFFSSCQWTPDGSSLLATSSDNTARIFVAPPDLLSDIDKSSNQIKDLIPYSRIQFPSAPTATAIYPGFQISEYAPALLLASTEDHPIKLYNVHSQECVASYPLFNPHRDLYDNTLALEFTGACGSNDTFLAGTRGQRGRVDLFSLLMPGASTETTHPLASAHIPESMAAGYRRAIVSAIATKPMQSNIPVAAVGFYQGGTERTARSSAVALYDFRVDSTNARCTILSPPLSSSGEFSWTQHTTGTTNLLWSPELGSDNLLYQVLRGGCSRVIVRDTRMGLGEVDQLRNPAFETLSTPQRLGIDWVPSLCGTPTFDLYAGTSTGSMFIYRDSSRSLAYRADDASVSEESPVISTQVETMKISNDSKTSVCGVSWNPQVNRNDLEVIATCYGTRRSTNEEDQHLGFPETGIKIWALFK